MKTKEKTGGRGGGGGGGTKTTERRGERCSPSGNALNGDETCDEENSEFENVELTTSEEEEDDANAASTKVCRICMCKETKSMPFVHLGCKCKGSMAVVHKVGSDFLFLTETLF